CRCLSSRTFHLSLYLLPPLPRSTLFPYTTLFRSELEIMGNTEDIAKVSRRDMAQVVATKQLGATTEASTMICAEMADIRFFVTRSEEHTSELQSRFDLVCRLLLEKKNNTITTQTT